MFANGPSGGQILEEFRRSVLEHTTRTTLRRVSPQYRPIIDVQPQRKKAAPRIQAALRRASPKLQKQQKTCDLELIPTFFTILISRRGENHSSINRLTCPSPSSALFFPRSTLPTIRPSARQRQREPHPFCDQVTDYQNHRAIGARDQGKQPLSHSPSPQFFVMMCTPQPSSVSCSIASRSLMLSCLRQYTHLFRGEDWSSLAIESLYHAHLAF